MKKFFGFRKKKKKEEPPPSPSRSGGGGEEPLRGKERGKLHRAAGGGDLKKLQQLVQKKKHDLNQLDEANRVSEKLIGDGSGNYAENSSSDSRKGLPVFSSPTKGGDTGFTLGAPATNKEEMLQAAGTAGNSGKVVDDLSEDSSRDSRKRDFDSWLTSEDEDFDFSPKKPQKPSLAQLVNVSQLFKKNNNKSEIGSNQLAKVEAGAQNPNPQELTDSNDSYVEEEEEEDCVDEGDENEEDRDEEEEEEFEEEDEEEEEESEDDFSQEKEDENIEESWGKLENEEEGFEKLGMRELSETFADNEHVRQQNSGNRNISSGSIGMCHVHREEIPESADVPVSPVVGCYECSDENIAITKVKNQFPSHSVEEENGCKFEGRNMDTHEYKEENTFKVPASAKSEFSSLLNKGRNSNLGNVFESDDDPVSDSELKRHKSRNQNSKNVNFVDYQNITEKQYSDLQELEEVVYEPLHHKSEQKMKENLKADFQSNIIEESSEEDGGGDDDDGDEEDRNVTCYRNSQDQNLVQDSCFTNDTSTLGMDKEVVNKNTESPWDSECTSESTRKPTVDALPTEHIRGVSEEACDGRLSDSQGPEGTKTREKQKTSLMEELGLDEADDIEDESDWDSTSLSLKSIPCAKPLNGFLLEDNAKSNAATKTSAIIPVGAELSDAQTIIPLKGVQGNDQKGIKEIGNDEHKDKSLTDTFNSIEKPSLENQTDKAEVSFTCKKKETEAGGHPEVSNNDCSQFDSVLWEERYEKMWVANEKREVKTCFKNITAELKQKFGEIDINERASNTFVEGRSQDNFSTVLEAEAVNESPSPPLSKATIDIQEKGDTRNANSVIAEKKFSTENLTLYSINCSSHKLLPKQCKNGKQNWTTNNEILSNLAKVMEVGVSGEGRHDTLVHLETTVGGKLTVPDKCLEYSPKCSCEDFKAACIRSPANRDNADVISDVTNSTVQESLYNFNHGVCRDCTVNDYKVVESEIGNNRKNPEQFCHHLSKKELGKELERDFARFKNEVEMLQTAFLALEQEKAQLQKEFEEEKRKQKWEQLEAAGKNENATTEKKMVVNPVEQKIEQKLTLKENQYFILEEEMLEKSHVKNITSSMERRELIPVTSKGKSARTMNGKKKIPRTVDITNDSDDLTQSSDTAAEDIDLPTSVYREAVMLIEQLSLDSKDSASLLKIQNVIHGYEHLIEHEKGHSAQLLRKVKKIKSEKKELQRMLEEMREMKSLLDQQKVEWESDISSLKFSLKQQEEKRISAEMLYEKNQERLKKKEEQYCKEMEEKQQLELMLRSLELELRTLKNHFKEVEQHHIETQRQLTQEQNARALQEGILNTHLWRQKELEEESKRALAKSSEVADNHDQEMDLLHKNHILQDELAVLRSELDHIKVQHQEQETKYLEENEALKEKAEELKKELKLSEEALTQTVFQYSGQINVTKTESALLTSKLEHIKEDKERLEVELHSFRSRLSSTTQELERTSMSKNDLERTLQRERDEWLRLKDKLTHDLSNLQETNNNMSHLLSKTESKANSLENELHHVTHTLREKNLLIESVQRDLSQAQCQVKGLENAQQMGKDQMNKYVIKQESMQERLAQLQSENLLLRQQLEDFQNQGIIKEKVVSDVQDRFNDIFTKLRSDTEKQVQMVEERNKELITKCNHLRDQVFKYEMEKVEREGALRQLQQELADSLKKQSMSEASLEITTCYRNDLEKDKQQLQKEIDRIKSKLQESEEQYIHSERRIQDLRNAVDAKESEANVLSQKLQDLLASSSGANNAIKQLEEHIQRLEIENARLEATNKQQTSRIEILQKDLQDSTAIHNRFEELITGLQTTKINLEEQLNHQVQKQTMLSVTAQDTHNMWEEELKSRSKLGVRLCELDREKTELKAQLDNEKKKVKKLAELKRSMEIQLDQETKRNSKLQEECNGIKKLLKTTKKKLKEYENGNNCSQIILQEEMKTRYSEIDIEVGKLKRKIDELSHQLEVKSTKCIQLESTNRDLREQLSPVKILHEKLGALEKSKQQLEDEVVNLKHHVQSHMIDSTQREQYKREIEERAGQEIRQKLEEVNWFLQWQELERYKELYSEEMKIRKALESKLDRANEKLSEANVSFLHEHQRTRSMLASSFLNGSLSASPVLETVQSGNLCSNLALNRTPSLGGFMNSSGNALSSKSKVEAYLTKMRRQLETNITRELAQANAELDVASATFSRIGSIDGSSKYIEQDQVSKATQEYLDVLKKNYML